MANNNYTGYQPSTSAHLANVLQQVFSNMLLGVNTLLPCTIEAVNDETPPTYDVQSLVNLQDINGIATPPAIIPSIPAQKIQQNKCGLIFPNYAVGDIVLVGFFQRDCTSVIASDWTRQNAGSYRKFALSDGVIICRLDDGVVPQYSIKFENDGTITITGTTININATAINFSTSNSTPATESLQLSNGSPSTFLKASS